jgi:hypothetical protein
MARAQMLMFARYLGVDIDEQNAAAIIERIAKA